MKTWIKILIYFITLIIIVVGANLIRKTDFYSYLVGLIVGQFNVHMVMWIMCGE